MTATCRIVRPTTGTSWDPVTESTIPNPPTTVVPTGTRCRVQAFTRRGQPAAQAGQTVAEGTYLVALPASAPAVDVECRVIIETCPADTALVDATLFIEDVQHGSERFQQDLACTINLG